MSAASSSIRPSRVNTAPRPAFIWRWVYPVVLVGLIVAFSEDHSPRVGLTWFGVFAVVSGAVLLAGGLRTLTDRVVRGVLIAEAVEPDKLDASELKSKLEDAEKFLIQKAIGRCQGNVSRAAEALGLSRSALYRRIQRYGL